MGEEVMARPLIYIAGPFRADTSWGIEQNIRRAEEHGLLVARLGGIPVIPHTMHRFYQDALPDEFWLEAGLALLRICAAVAVCVDEERAQRSFGTVAEIGEARVRGLPVHHNDRDTRAFQFWIDTRIAEVSK
jgi:nucleoside 2-deoxyribosyltransferase